MFYCLFVRPSDAPSPLVLLQGIWLGDLTAGYAALQPLVALAQASNATGSASASIIETDYLTAHELFEGPLGSRTANKQKSAFAPLNYTTDGAFPIVSPSSLETISSYLMATPPDVADNSAVYLNLMGGAINAAQPDATAFPHRDALCNFVIDTHWVDNSTTPAALSWTRALFSSMANGGFLGPSIADDSEGETEAAEDDRGDATTMVLPTYVNYADGDLQNWQAAYYGTRGGYQRLQAVKAAYDPGTVFDFPQAVRQPQAQKAAETLDGL